MAGKYVIVSAKRSPFGKYLGSLSQIEPLEVASQVARAALTATGQDLGEYIEQIFVGNCFATAFETASITGRQIALKIGLDVFTITLDTACCSPLTALRMALWGLRLGEYQVALVIGVEAMSRIPHLSRQLRSGVRIGEVNLNDPIFPIAYAGYNPVAVDAANGAKKYGVSRRMLDNMGVGSHLKWANAQAAGKFTDEIVPLKVRKGKNKFIFAQDESPRTQATVATTAMLPPIFGSKTTTAGNAPGLSDGASAMVIMTETKAKELGLRILATIVDQAGHTDQPHGISWIPALAINKVLHKNGLAIDDMDLIEINEAFAAMPLVSTKILAGEDETKWHSLLAKTNVNGGAIAIGHPVGASGLRVAMTMMYELRRRGGGQGVAAICGGLTQGEAVIVRVA
ncbi:Acetyl-CoA acetyltransferase [Desulfarculales bacterium]